MKKLILKLIFLTSFSFIIVGAVNFAIDPLQFYRESRFYNPYYYNQTRFQNPAIARTHTYDSIILGTSMAENFSTSQIKSVLEINPVNLALEGSSCYEESLLLNVALHKNTLSKVIWSLDYCSFNDTSTSVRDENVDFPFYLYDQSFLNDYKYLIGSNTTNRIIDTFLFNFFRIGNERLSTLEERMYWYDYYEYSKNRVVAAWNEYGYVISPDKNQYRWENIKENIDKNIIPYVMENPDVTFYFYHVPYSVLQFKYFANNEYFDNLIKYKNYLFESIGNLDNVKIYDFQMDFNLIGNLDNYKDLAHHSKEINDYIIKCIKDNEFLVLDNNEAQDKLLYDFVTGYSVDD